MVRVKHMAAKKYIIIIMLGIFLLLFGGVLVWLNQEIEYAPADVQVDKVAYHQPVYLLGRVAEGSLRYLSQDNAYQFIVQDTQASITVLFSHLLPSDFHEGKTVRLHGQLRDETHFFAETIHVSVPGVKSSV